MKQIVHHTDDRVLIQSIYRNDKIEFLTWDKGDCRIKETSTIDEEYEPLPLLWAEKGCLILPTGYSMEAHDDLLGDLYAYFKNKVLIDDKYIWLMAAYAYYTWFYDKLSTAPYLFIVGDYGTAKTRILELLQFVSFNAVNLGTSVTNANIFRVQDMAKGTLILDEFEKNATSKNDDYAQILNNGYSHPGIVIRSESDGKKYSPTAYSVYGPKIIGARELPNDKALTSRCFIIPTEHHNNDELNDAGILLDLTDENRLEAEMLRNRLLGLRFAKAEKIVHLSKEITFRTSKPRNVQLLKAMVSVMPSRAHKRMASILEALLVGSNVYKNRQIELDVVFALDIVLRNKYQSWKNELPIYISLMEVGEAISKAIKRHYSNKELGMAARALGLKTVRRNKGVMVKIDSASEHGELSERILGVLDAVECT